MPVLVDGHNLIGQMPNLSLADSDDEAQLVLLLRRYATRKRRGKVVVVFDHGVYGHPENLNGYGVECHFAMSPRDADSYLIRRIRSIRRTGDWYVVTSDRAVAGEARARGIRVVSARAFARTLLALNEPSVRAEDKANDRPLSAQEIEEWLRLFGESPNDADQPAE